MYCDFTVYDDDNYDPEDDFDSDEPEEEATPHRKHYRYLKDPKNKMFQAIISTYGFEKKTNDKRFLLNLGVCSAVITLGDDVNRFDMFDEDGTEIEVETWETLPELLEILEENLTLETDSEAIDWWNPWYVEKLK